MKQNLHIKELAEAEERQMILGLKMPENQKALSPEDSQVGTEKLQNEFATEEEKPTTLGQ